MPPADPAPQPPHRRKPCWTRRPRAQHGPAAAPTHGTYDAVTRVEVSEPGNGRAFVAYYAGPGLEWSLQDPDPLTGAPRTLKLFPHHPRYTGLFEPAPMKPAS